VVGQESQVEAVRLLVLLRVMLCMMLCDASYALRAQHHSRSNNMLHALWRLPTIASALSHHRERIPDDVSTRGDVDACSRALRAVILIILKYFIVFYYI